MSYTGIDIQVICRACLKPMPLEGMNEQGAVFACEDCGTSIIVRLRTQAVQ